MATQVAVKSQVLFFNGHDVRATLARGRGREETQLTRSEVSRIYSEFRSRPNFSNWVPKWIQFDADGFWFAGDEETTRW
jgi:hypothetical protein